MKVGGNGPITLSVGARGAWTFSNSDGEVGLDKHKGSGQQVQAHKPMLMM